MKKWKRFFPDRNQIEALGTIKAGVYCIDTNANPEWASVYLPTRTGEWIALTWNYFDIEFKFETYGVSIELVQRAPTTLVDAGNIGEFEHIDFYAKTEWTRPAVPGEVPSDFEQIIEAAGRLDEVPTDAISVGTSLHAVVFRSIGGDSDVMICIDDDARFSLKAMVGSQGIEAIRQTCDVFNSVELISWEPPV
ncbi:hypothetical protein P3W24_15110 [Luteibacter sp. PPL201]|uniref:Uncharacterized protein n=1 Tax=Luteibacter sahnii TaxID=3021977 RepID=A0ABT6BDU6_9GAMM|nr:hypothetical protein [Luteibacter sp. PPL193]MDY1548874.1 hypothetical protein [Luteibacter sp. PPL193]